MSISGRSSWWRDYRGGFTIEVGAMIVGCSIWAEAGMESKSPETWVLQSSIGEVSEEEQDIEDGTTSAFSGKIVSLKITCLDT